MDRREWWNLKQTVWDEEIQVQGEKESTKGHIVPDITVLMWDKQDCAAAWYSSAELCRRTDVNK